VETDRNISESKKQFYHLVDGSVKVQYIMGVAMREWEPHCETKWRVLPYTTIVTTGELDGAYQAEMKGKGIIRIPINSVFVIPPGKAFRMKLKETAYLGNAHIAFPVLGHIDILSFFDFPCLIQEPASLEIIRIVDELAICTQREERTLELTDMIHRKHLEFKLLELLIKQAGLNSDVGARLTDMHRMQTVLDYINDHMPEEMSRKNLADLVNLSETRFHYVFKKIMGTSPMNYLMMQRLQEAQKRLLVTDASVTEIAGAVGFTNVSYFSKLFKSKFHVSPLQYRQIKNSHFWR